MAPKRNTRAQPIEAAAGVDADPGTGSKRDLVASDTEVEEFEAPPRKQPKAATHFLAEEPETPATSEMGDGGASTLSLLGTPEQIGRASCRERVCLYV